MAERPIWAWDIEATDWDRVVCVVARSTAGDREAFYGVDALERMAEVMQKAGGNWIAHAGGIYDTLLLSNVWPRPWPSLIMSGSAVLCARDGAFRARDSFRWWLAGLGAVGKYLEKIEARKPVGERAPPGRWLKLEVDRRRIDSLTADETLSYCDRDVEILLRGVLEARAYLDSQKARMAWTAGSSALNLLSALEPYSWRALERFRLHFDDVQAAHRGVRGARVECWARGVVPGVYCYDFKSAYPASYSHEPLGIGARKARPGDTVGVWRCRWRWPHRDRLPPVLDQETLAGAGWCEAWCIHEEIEALESEGVAVDRLEGYAAEEVLPLGQIFCRELYQQKEAGSFFAKVFLNAKHGKLSETPIREAWTSREKPADWYGPDPVLIGPYWRSWEQNIDKKGRCPRHLQPIAAAQILGRTRVRLWRALRAAQDAGGRVFYCDTDSVHTDLPPDAMRRAIERAGLTYGTELGALAFEGGPFVGHYLGPKAYTLTVDGVAQKGALKGVPWKGLHDAVRVERDRDGMTIPIRRYRQARGAEVGRDVRVDVFRDAMDPSGVQIVKEGIASWSQGVRSQKWGRAELPRTIRPVARGKTFDALGAPTVWAYQTPAEVLLALKDLSMDAEPRPDAPAELDYLDLFEPH